MANLPYRITADGTLTLDDVPRPSKVAIVGAGASRVAAPLDDPTWDVWGLNNLKIRDRAGHFRGDRWFELHPYAAQSTEDLQFIEACPVPLYVLDLMPAVKNPRQIRFPFEWIKVRFPQAPFFACTFAYQIAFALVLNIHEIGLFGVDLDLGSDRERTVERTTVAYWVGVAQGMGRKITIPPTCGLLRHPYRYGYDYLEEIAYVKEWLARDSAPDEPVIWHQRRVT